MAVFNISRFLMDDVETFTDSQWIEELIYNISKLFEEWGEQICVILGIIMVGFGIYRIARGLMSGGRSQVNWPVSIACLFFGAAMAFGGIMSVFQNIAKGATTELEGLPNAQAADAAVPDVPTAIIIDIDGLHLQ